MSQVCAIPEIRIGDIILVKRGTDSKIFELDDIACWEKDHMIKTINMVEKELRSYQFETKKQFKEAKKELQQKIKLVIKTGDQVVVKCRHDQTPYEITVRCGNSYDPKEITQVHFNKMMIP